MRLFIVGATGYIGKALHERAKSMYVTHGTSSREVEGLIPLCLERGGEFDFSMIQPADVVLLSAAISSPDICSREHTLAWAVNVTGTSEFVTHVIARGGRVVFFSSDTVYGERDNSFDETAEKNPAGEYAEMKSELENRFKGNSLFKSIRLSYVFSREDKFAKYLSNCAEGGEEAELFHPFNRAVVHRDDVIEGALALAERWDEFPQEIINFGGPEVLSRINFAECMKSSALPNLRYRVSQPGEAFFKNRPRVIAMSSTVLPKLLGRPSCFLFEAVKKEFFSN